MPLLDGMQLDRLVDAMSHAFTSVSLERFARYHLSTDLDDVSAPIEPKPDRIYKLIDSFDRRKKVCELLEACTGLDDHPSLKALAEELVAEVCTGSADGAAAAEDPAAACVISGRAFVNRDRLRDMMGDFAREDTPLVMIKGPKASGKSHSWYFIRNLAKKGYEVRARLVDLKQWRGPDAPSPDELMDSIASQLDLSKENWPTDDLAQGERRATKLKDWFVGRTSRLTEPCWLVVDHLDRHDLRDDVLELVEQLAVAVARGGLDHVSLVLIGFPRTLPGDLEPFVPREQVEVFGEVDVKSHFRDLAAQCGHAISDAKVDSLATEVFDGLASPFGRKQMFEIAGRLAGLSASVVRGENL